MQQAHSVCLSHFGLRTVIFVLFYDFHRRRTHDIGQAAEPSAPSRQPGCTGPTSSRHRKPHRIYCPLDEPTR